MSAVYPRLTAHEQYPPNCGAYFSGSATNLALFAAVANRQTAPCHWCWNSGMPLIGRPASLYATGSYPFSASLWASWLTADFCPLASLTTTDRASAAMIMTCCHKRTDMSPPGDRRAIPLLILG